MYPRPMPETAIWQRRFYVIAVLAILILWLCALFAVILTSLRSTQDVMGGNLWGWPTQFGLIENYTAVHPDDGTLFPEPPADLILVIGV